MIYDLEPLFLLLTLKARYLCIPTITFTCVSVISNVFYRFCSKVPCRTIIFHRNGGFSYFPAVKIWVTVVQVVERVRPAPEDGICDIYSLLDRTKNVRIHIYRHTSA